MAIQSQINISNSNNLRSEMEEIARSIAATMPTNNLVYLRHTHKQPIDLNTMISTDYYGSRSPFGPTVGE